MPIRISCSVKAYGLEAIYGAAYVLTDRAYARLSGNPKSSIAVSLETKSKDLTVSDLKKTFMEELRTQKIRWEIAKNNQAIREFIVEQAVRGAQAAPAPSPIPELTVQEREEIEKLIAEVESEIKDRNKSKTDPLNISATWEERHAPETKTA